MSGRPILKSTFIRGSFGAWTEWHVNINDVSCL